MKRFFILAISALTVFLCSLIYPPKLNAQNYFTVVILSDPHLNQNGHDGTSIENMNTYIQNIIGMGKSGGKRISFTALPSYVPKADLVLCLGDMDQDSMDDHTTFEEVFSAFLSAGIPFLTMAGNHDYVPDYWDNGTEAALTGGNGGIADNEATKATVNKFKEASAQCGVEDICTINDNSGHRQGDPYTFRFRGVRFYCGQEYWFYKPYSVTKFLNYVTGYDKYYAPDGVISALENFVSEHKDEPSVWTQHFPILAGSDNERWWLDNNNTGNHIEPSDETAYKTAYEKKQKYASLIKQTLNPVHFSGHTHTWSKNTYSGITDYTVASPGYDAGAAYVVLCQEGVGVVEVQQAHFNTNTPIVEPTQAYLYNLGTKEYLSSGADWGTQALTDEVGLLLNMEFSGIGRTIDGGIYNSDTDHYLGSPDVLYMDQPAHVWQFIPTSATSNTYRITSDGTNFLAANTETHLLEMSDRTVPQNVRWRIVDRDDRIASLSSATLTRPGDASFLISCPDFGRNDARFSAWAGEPIQGGLNSNMCAEKFNTSFDVYQELDNVPNGWYKLSCQGFYRAGIDGNASLGGEANPHPAQLYANAVSVPLMNIHDEQLTQYPNSMSEASGVFSEGLYSDNSVCVEVTDGKLRLGIRKTAEVANDWTIFDHFRLKYYKNNDPSSLVSPKAMDNEDITSFYDLTGRRLSSPSRKGVIIRSGKKLLVR
ncbi:MAG: metallophosphoesterase [Bacteroidaceae bacterium]|nr:metallophosphoesterase [Bacteroidaceae bacterium]